MHALLVAGKIVFFILFMAVVLSPIWIAIWWSRKTKRAFNNPATRAKVSRRAEFFVKPLSKNFYANYEFGFGIVVAGIVAIILIKVWQSLTS